MTAGYARGVAQDMTPPPRGGLDGPHPYSDHEQQALSLAQELRTRVQRERATIANLRAYLSRGRPS
jgi:hypothetical protein